MKRRRARPATCALAHACWLSLLVLPPAATPARAQVHFDLASARRATDLDVQEVPGSARTMLGVSVREVQFDSIAWSARGQAQPIRIRAFLALPAGALAPRSKPAVVAAHGLGAHAEPEQAAQIAANLDAVALTLSAPGLGGSDGHAPTAEDARPLFTTLPDVRGSWLYAYAYAILRAVTVLEARPEVDPRGIVVTGTSMGGLCCFMVGALDDRIRGILPVSAAGDLARIASEPTWFRQLLGSAGGLRAADPAARAFFRAFDPLLYAPRQKGAVYWIIGAQDEFFPLDAVAATWRALRAPARSLEIVADYDHGWYFGAGCPARCMPGSAKVQPGAAAGANAAACPRAPACPARCPEGAETPYCGPQASYNHQDDFVSRWALLLRALLAQHASHRTRPYGPPPAPPTLERRRQEIVVRVAATPPPRVVRLAVSEDGGTTFGQFVLSRGPDGAWHHGRPAGPQTIVLAEAEAEDGTCATSLPVLPAGFVPRVRRFGPAP